MSGKISPSVMCANMINLGKDIKLLERAGAEYLHIDVMDGHFVPNFTLGPDLVKSLRKITDIPMDIHFMVENPGNYLNLFEPKPGDIVCIHQESTKHLQRVLQQIKEFGAKPAVAINPATPIIMIENVIRDIDVLLVMTVNPGFAGQKLVPETLNKIKEIDKIRREQNLKIDIMVDGNVSFENAKTMRDSGADIFVAGTSSIFNKDMSIEEAAAKLRSVIV